MILVDAPVILDVLTRDPQWLEWSRKRLIALAQTGSLAINPVIFAEVSAGFATRSEADMILARWELIRLPLPYEASYRAGRAFVAFREQESEHTAGPPFPDFFIGAHAEVASLTLLTRDPTRFRTYFPKVQLIAPSAGEGGH